ncbi:MAG: hypothetical protein M3015_01745 [Bacteroidota bacterium]|nr:hypothetical protein [Bacteroidota bacterium]
MKKIAISFLLLFCISFIRAQTVNNTSYITQGGEKVLRIEMILRCDKKKPGIILQKTNYYRNGLLLWRTSN